MGVTINNRTTALEWTVAKATGAQMHFTGTKPSPYINTTENVQTCERLYLEKLAHD